MTTPSPARSSAIATIALSIAVVALLVPTVLAVAQVGLLGIFSSVTANWASVQIFVDLLIMCVLAIVWMYHDSRATGRVLWPWVVLTLAAGAFGVLGYLLAGQRRTRTPNHASH